MLEKIVNSSWLAYDMVKDMLSFPKFVSKRKLRRIVKTEKRRLISGRYLMNENYCDGAMEEIRARKQCIVRIGNKKANLTEKLEPLFVALEKY